MHFGAGRFECLPSKCILSLSLSKGNVPLKIYHNASQVSAGHAHSAAVTTDGELYCWGNNKGGCCGQPLAARSVVRYYYSFFRLFNSSKHVYVFPTQINGGMVVGFMDQL